MQFGLWAPLITQAKLVALADAFDLGTLQSFDCDKRSCLVWPFITVERHAGFALGEVFHANSNRSNLPRACRSGLRTPAAATRRECVALYWPLVRPRRSCAFDAE
jgi:hypothetical protein